MTGGRTDQTGRKSDEKRCFQFACAAGKIVMRQEEETGWLTWSAAVARVETNGLYVIVLENEPRISIWRIWGRPIRRNVKKGGE